MRMLCTTALLLGAAALFQAAAAPPALPPPTLCRVVVTREPHVLGRVLKIQLRPECPPDSVAHVRLESKLGGSQPDKPPGVYTIRKGQVLRRVAFSWWWVGWIDRIGRSWLVPEQEVK